jgi:hypothetical protein
MRSGQDNYKCWNPGIAPDSNVPECSRMPQNAPRTPENAKRTQFPKNRHCPCVDRALRHLFSSESSCHRTREQVGASFALLGDDAVPAPGCAPSLRRRLTRCRRSWRVATVRASRARWTAQASPTPARRSLSRVGNMPRRGPVLRPAAHDSRHKRNAADLGKHCYQDVAPRDLHYPRAGFRVDCPIPRGARDVVRRPRAANTELNTVGD